MYKNINKLGDAGVALLNKKAHIGWTTHAHSAHAVPIFAIGAGAEQFTGWHDNTEIAPMILKAATEKAKGKIKSANSLKLSSLSEL